MVSPAKLENRLSDARSLSNGCPQTAKEYPMSGADAGAIRTVGICPESANVPRMQLLLVEDDPTMRCVSRCTAH